MINQIIIDVYVIACAHESPQCDMQKWLQNSTCHENENEECGSPWPSNLFIEYYTHELDLTTITNFVKVAISRLQILFFFFCDLLPDLSGNARGILYFLRVFIMFLVYMSGLMVTISYKSI